MGRPRASPERTVLLGTYIPLSEMELVARVAAVKGVSKSALLRAAIREFTERDATFADSQIAA